MEAVQVAGCCNKSWSAHSRLAAITKICASSSRETGAVSRLSLTHVGGCVALHDTAAVSHVAVRSSSAVCGSHSGNSGGRRPMRQQWQKPMQTRWVKPSGKVSPKQGSTMAVSCALGTGKQEDEPPTIAGAFDKLKRDGRASAFIPFIMAGHPSLEITEAVLLELDACGADIIELGVPYSDPLADGPVIQAAATRALQNGTTMSSVFRLLERVTPRIKAPIVLFTYFNPVLRIGLDSFLKQVKSIGAAGLVIPDLPLEETLPISKLSSVYGLELVLLTTPTTPLDRMRLIADAAQGFVYLVSVTGVTGARGEVAAEVEGLMKQLKGVTDKAVAVGFGISTAKHAQRLVDWGADGVIVGSAIVRALESTTTKEEAIAAVSAIAADIRSGTFHKIAAV